MSDLDPAKRDYLLPPGCKDLFDALQKRKQEEKDASPRYPPITRKVRLPEKVAVRYLAELTGLSLGSIEQLLRERRIGISVTRSVDFRHAQLILREFGIWADRESTRV